MKRSWKKSAPDAQIRALAESFVPGHDTLLSEGYRLMPSSGLWDTRGKGMTARFVYRQEPVGRGPEAVLTFTYRRIGA